MSGVAVTLAIRMRQGRVMVLVVQSAVSGIPGHAYPRSEPQPWMLRKKTLNPKPKARNQAALHRAGRAESRPAIARVKGVGTFGACVVGDAGMNGFAWVLSIDTKITLNFFQLP